ncbi:hypothetical protein CMI47_07535 [Candidatus Pacearchaeota archaeon]|nr:hypothetical protein [Candidatus Pacearchaeota archaeon]|tara:strand:+ start:736 stop:1074 length:339 start_codon:yes stop_codon:yes gene_type:complete
MSDIKVVVNPENVDIVVAPEVININSYAASADSKLVSFDPAGTGISAINVQDAIVEVEHRKFTQATAPSGSTIAEGDTWYDTDDDKLYVYHENTWREITVTGVTVMDGGEFS